MSKSSRVIDGLKTDTIYSFHVRAKNTIGKWSPLSDLVSHTTLKDTSAPADPTGGSVGIPNPNFFLLKWAMGTENDLESYNIYVYTADTAASAKIIKRVGWSTNFVAVYEGDQTEDTTITIAHSTTYYFWVTAVDESGNESDKLALGSDSLPEVSWPPA